MNEQNEENKRIPNTYDELVMAGRVQPPKRKILPQSKNPVKMERCFFFRDHRQMMGVQKNFFRGEFFEVDYESYRQFRALGLCLAVDNMARPAGLEQEVQFGLGSYNNRAVVMFASNSTSAFADWNKPLQPNEERLVILSPYPERLKNVVWQAGDVIPVADVSELLQLGDNRQFQGVLKAIQCRLIQWT